MTSEADEAVVGFFKVSSDVVEEPPSFIKGLYPAAFTYKEKYTVMET